MKLVWQCIFSPRLYKIYREGSRENTYCSKSFEKWGDMVISSANIILNIGIYTSPFICMYIYQKGMYSLDHTWGFLRFLGGFGFILAASYMLRAIGRASNPNYTKFIKTLNTTGPNGKVNLDSIRQYDFEFHAWPTTYSVPLKQKSKWLTNPFAQTANGHLPGYQRVPIQLLAYIATHTFGLRLIFPGSLAIINTLLWNALFDGRTQLIERHNGKRTKIGTADGNAIDTLFVDNRDQHANGNYLVICCEGNSGFYEVGIMNTPIKREYSTLGWNHPGFAGSTGQPYPDQEQNAIDAVMQFAINELKFQPEHIIMFGWSIGGYAAAWTAVNYPVHGLILDATFDDLLPLAEKQMPRSWSLLVREVVRTHVDLDIANLVANFRGPVQMVRRTEDEIICLRPGLVSTNRGNDLVVKLIESRHPEVASPDFESSVSLEKLVALLDNQRATLERSEISAGDRKLLQLINTYMVDYKSTHCVPLPDQMFQTIMDKIKKQIKKPSDPLTQLSIN